MSVTTTIAKKEPPFCLPIRRWRGFLLPGKVREEALQVVGEVSFKAAGLLNQGPANGAAPVGVGHDSRYWNVFHYAQSHLVGFLASIKGSG